MGAERTITATDLSKQLRCTDPSVVCGFDKMLKDVNTLYQAATASDIERYHAEIIQRMSISGAKRNKDENYNVWENGWSQNLEAIKENFHEECLKPKYFKHSKYFRFNRSIILPENQNLEHDLFSIMRNYLFRKYFRGFDVAYELGCGSCQNVYALSKIYPEMKIIASDWTEASRQIAAIVNQNVSAEIIGRQFDMLDPPPDFDIEPNSIVFTIHALEQLNTGYENLVQYLLDKKPALVLNCEPIVEFYDETNIYDYLALQYSHARGYLSGYLSCLRDYEKAGRLKIEEQYRPYIGGVYHEASLVVWKPL